MKGIECPDCGYRQIYVYQNVDIIQKVKEDGSFSKKKEIAHYDQIHYECRQCDEIFTENQLKIEQIGDYS